MHANLMRRGVMCLVLVLTACGTPLPPMPPARLGLKLAPAALGQVLALQQHLTVERNGRIDELDTALEVDADHLELIGLAFGQRVLSLNYNGRDLRSWRHPMLPSQVRAEDVLEDLQLTLWPREVISQVLPTGWRVEDEGLRRRLYSGTTLVTEIVHDRLPTWSGTTTLENLRYHYRLTIQSAPTAP